MYIKPKDTNDEPFAEFDEQEKRDALGKGLAEFNKKTLVFLHYRYLCDKNRT